MDTKYYRYREKYPFTNPKDFIPYIEEDLEFVRNYYNQRSQNKTDRNIDMWKEYYSSDVTPKELGAKHGISASTCSNQIGRINHILEFRKRVRR